MIQSVVTFNGLNFTEWDEKVQFALGSMDLEDAILTEKSAALHDKSSDEEKAIMVGWEKKNIMTLMFLKMTVATNVKISLPTTTNAKDFLESVKAQSQSADKSVASTLMSKLITMKYDGSLTMHQHILEMTSLASKLNGVGMTVDEPFLVQFIINSLPFDQYGPFQMNYNTLKDKWIVHELSGMLIQEEQRIKDSKPPTVHLVSHNGTSTSDIKKSGGGKGKKKGSSTHKASTGTLKKTSKERCNFCKKVGHFQKDCMKRRQ
jgi:gag-polypeptide of LTR copia-type